MSLYMQEDYAENSDPERDWGATESVPILTEACNQFQARTYKIFFPGQTFVSAQPVGRNDELFRQRAERVGKHISYQLGIRDKTYKPNKSALFLGVATHGSFFTKTYPTNPQKSRFKLPFRIDNVRPTDLVINYHNGPIRIEDVRRKTHIIHTTVGETSRMASDGYLLSAAKANMGQHQSTYDKKVDEIAGFSPNSNTRLKSDNQATLAEQHFYLDIDDDGSFLPYIGTIDVSTGELLRLTIGYEADDIGNPLRDYEQIQYFTHYKFMEDPNGFYGLGLGHMLGDLNASVNIMLRQSMDAATLSNHGNSSGFISSRLGIEGDEVTMTLGKFTKIEDAAGDLQNGVFQFKFPGPSDALIKIMEAMDQRAQRLGSITEATTGSIDTNRQPTTVLAQIEQSLEYFSSVQMMIANSLGDELDKVFRINQRFTPAVEYFVVNGQPENITRADYGDDMMIAPIFDPKFTTRAQKIAKAQAEIQATMQNPLSQTRPWVYDVAYRRYLEALEAENIDELVPPVTPDGIMKYAMAMVDQAQQRQQTNEKEARQGDKNAVAESGGNSMDGRANPAASPVMASFGSA